MAHKIPGMAKMRASICLKREQLWLNSLGCSVLGSNTEQGNFSAGIRHLRSVGGSNPTIGEIFISLFFVIKKRKRRKMCRAFAYVNWLFKLLINYIFLFKRGFSYQLELQLFWS